MIGKAYLSDLNSYKYAKGVLFALDFRTGFSKLRADQKKSTV